MERVDKSTLDRASVEILSDEVLCEVIQNQSELSTKAEEELVSRYDRLVRICARPWFLSGGDSEDLIQEGMFGLLNAVRSYRPDCKASFHTFAEVCIRNRLRSAIRAASGGKHTPLNNSISMDAPNIENEFLTFFEESPEDAMIHKEEWEHCLQQLQSQLSNFEQLVLSFYLKGFTTTEIALKVNRTSKSVDNAVQRIRKKLTKK